MFGYYQDADVKYMDYECHETAVNTNRWVFAV